MNKDKFIDKVLFETIYHWQKSEYKYFQSIQTAFDNRSDEKLLIKFAEREYYEFLNDYGIRRSLQGKGKKPVVNLVIDIFKENGFAESLKDFEDNQELIDNYCEELSCKKEISGGRKLLSLITKTAFILKPDTIPLYDNYAKKSLIKNDKSLKISNFKSFFIAFKKYKESNIVSIRSRVDGFKSVYEKFDEFKMENINEFIAHRSIDKMLWMEYYYYIKNNKSV